MNEDLREHRWFVENCHNPSKGWIQNSHGVRLNKLSSRAMCGRIVRAHNQEISLIESKLQEKAA